MIQEHKEDTELEELEINTYKSIKLIFQQDKTKKEKRLKTQQAYFELL